MSALRFCESLSLSSSFYSLPSVNSGKNFVIPIQFYPSSHDDSHHFRKNGLPSKYNDKIGSFDNRRVFGSRITCSTEMAHGTEVVVKKKSESDVSLAGGKGKIMGLLGNNEGLEKVKNLIIQSGVPPTITSPLISLQKGKWVKLICGASFEDIVDIRNLSLVYTLSGVDCTDCAAEASVVNAVNDGIEAARSIIPIRRPWVMISVNDDEDLHFRKAEFDPDDCPADCSRPCENVCPANAISHLDKAGSSKGGVLTERCYGCGRCLPVCPYDRIKAVTYIRDINATADLLKQDGVDALEIHTSGKQVESFRELWKGLGSSLDQLKLVAVSLPDIGASTISTMDFMYSVMKVNLQCPNLWQLDGRPMSGDIGRGATREAIAFARHLTSVRDRPEGFLQLAGGTNAHTVNGLKKENLFQTSYRSANNEIVPLSSTDSSNALISGVAFGGYARKIVGRVLSSVQLGQGYAHIEEFPDHLYKAVAEALSLVGTVKCYNSNQI